MKTFLPKATGIALTAMSAAAFLGAGAASAGTVDGTATAVAGNNAGTTVVSSGNSDTKIGFQLQPNTAANGVVNNRANCSADSNHGTNSYIYLVHPQDTVTGLNFSGGEPPTYPGDPNTLSMFNDQGQIETGTGNFYGNTQNVAPNTGQINLPPTQAFQFGQITALSGGGFPLTGANGLMYQTDASGNPYGTWHGGWACYQAVVGSSSVTDYWGYMITFKRDTTAAGGSQGFTWTLTPDSQSAPATPEVPFAIILPLSGAALIGGGVIYSRRKASRPVAAA